ncbi:MAG: InlB B-repeat-containing protein, partial [Clostridia bacterium]|nr:InlB B-repeat-containing protein [Clostridia bacterium]
HNMYGINNTDGEIEIYNDDVSSSANMSGRSFKDSYTGVGFAWAAVYGANNSEGDLMGTVTVEVYDANGKLLATDSHTGTREKTDTIWGFIPVYTYHGFVESDLEADVQEISFGMFERDRKNVKVLLGESSIVHITCVECTVSDATVVPEEADGTIISVVKSDSDNEIFISGIQATEAGTAQVKFSITKGNCKFHQNDTSTQTINVHVYAKPTTTSTATAIELRNLDDRCTYYINGVKGVKITENGDEYVVFEGLTPNTDYQIEVVGQVDGTDPVYAYVYETTKPAYVGTVEVILNGTYDTSTGTATGERVDISTVLPGCETLYLHYEDSNIFIPMTKTATGVYTAELSNGNYTICSAVDDSAKLSDQILTITDASRTRELFFNSVTYDLSGGTNGPDPTTEYYLVESAVTVSANIPTKEGYLFTHWEDEDGNQYAPGAALTDSVGEAYTLTAQYVESMDVYVNIIINHKDGNGLNNDTDSMHDITFTVDARQGTTGDYTELISQTIEWDGKSVFTGTTHTASYNAESGVTSYTATAPTLVNFAKAMDYTFTTTKSGYEIKSITTQTDANGDLWITAELIFDPNDFDLAFTVELDEHSQTLTDDLKPVAVNVKVTSWLDTPYDADYGKPENDETVDWFTITPQRFTYERIALGEDGKGIGTYPVWINKSDGTPYYYRIEVVSYELPDRSIMAADDLNDAHTTYVTADERYRAEIQVDNGADPDTTDQSTLTGAYYADGAQVGSIKAVVTIEVFDVTFDPNGGTLNGSMGDTVVEHQIAIPALTDYTPTRDGGYVFDGWYYADANGDITNTLAVSDTVLFKNETLIAKWKEPLTVSGILAIAGTYTLTEDGKETTHEIPEQDRLKQTTVLLQKIDANGYTVTVRTLDVSVTYQNDYGTGAYEFTEIPDDGHSYRLLVVSSSYHEHYQNETLGNFDVTAYDTYTETMYTAVFGNDTTAVVNIYLHFMPDTFELQYTVDATAIGEASRPTAVEVLVLYDDGGGHLMPQHWPVISQMIHSGSYEGNSHTLTDGKASGSELSEPVWISKTDDSAFYDYAIRVDSLTFGETETAFSDDLPYTVAYNGSARYSAINESGQTQILTATLLPRMYTITFDMNRYDPENETASEYQIPNTAITTDMEAYRHVETDMTVTYHDTYYWSYGKTIEAKPEAEGYTFLGWYDADGNAVTSISPSTDRNITLYARWSPAAEFETLADAGYYASKRDAAEKVGVISLNARITNYADVKDSISAFGVYVYDVTGGIKKITTVSENTEALESATTAGGSDPGAFHILITNIPQDKFGSVVYAVPYVVINGNTHLGERIKTASGASPSVSAVNKWLGPQGGVTEGGVIGNEKV